MAQIESPTRISEDSQARGRRAERRGAPRVPSRVLFSAGRIEGKGVIQDLSLCGANVVARGGIPEVGDMVKLLFPDGGPQAPPEVLAEVTRRTRWGFAVRFCQLDRRLRGYLVAAGVGMLRFNDCDDAAIELKTRDPSEARRRASTRAVEQAADETPEHMVVYPGYLFEREVG